MKRKIVVALVLAVCVAAVFLYSQGLLDRKAERLGYKPLPEYSDPSRVIKTTVGAEFMISLDSNRTTGYGWEIVGGVDERWLKLVEIQHRASRSQLVGAGGKDTWTFKALQKGRTTLSLEYIRPWEKGVPPAKQAVFSIEIG